MPLTARAEPPPDQFIISTSVSRFASWIKEHLRAMLGGRPDGREHDFLILHEITEEQTEFGSLLIDVDVSGVDMFVDPCTEEDQSEIEHLPHYMSFLLIELEGDRIEVWTRYSHRAALHDYNTLKREIEERWPGSPKQVTYQIEWPRSIKHAREKQKSGGHSHTQAIRTDKRRPSRPIGRPRNEHDEWARKQIWWQGERPDRVFTLWKNKLSPERLGLMADPRDSFRKLMKRPPKEGNDVA